MLRGSKAFITRTLRCRDSFSFCRRKTSTAGSFVSVLNKGRVSVPSLSAEFPFLWLRDSCQCASCVHPSTRQKLHKSSDIHPQIKPLRLMDKPDGLQIDWEPFDGRPEHASFYPSDFLRRHASPANLLQFHKEVPAQRWTSKHFANRSGPEELSFEYPVLLRDPQALHTAYTDLAKYGLVFIRNMPTERVADADCELRSFAQKFGMLRNTFYGETWDVKNIKNSKNIAYTNLDLGLHMDLLYFVEPPRYQILHCLRNKVDGGHSLFVDGLNAALELYESSPEEFFCLADTNVAFHYINDGHHLQCLHPTFVLDGKTGNQSPRSVVRDGKPYKISAINYSPPFQAPLPLDTPPSFYSALATYSDILNKASNRFTYLLREGEAVIFDNRRVLHGRTSFSDRGDSLNRDGETSRWLKGCYLEEDAVLDKRRVLAGNLLTGA